MPKDLPNLRPQMNTSVLAETARASCCALLRYFCSIRIYIFEILSQESPGFLLCSRLRLDAMTSGFTVRE